MGAMITPSSNSFTNYVESILEERRPTIEQLMPPTANTTYLRVRPGDYIKRLYWERANDDLTLDENKRQEYMAQSEKGGSTLQRDALQELRKKLKDAKYYLVTVVGNDERELIEGCYKIYYLFSHANEDQFVLIEYPLGFVPRSSNQQVKPETEYPTLYWDFAAVDPFERELIDVLGLFPGSTKRPRSVTAGSWLHRECYSPNLFPLRRDRDTAARVAGFRQAPNLEPPASREEQNLEGEWELVIGPIHAGIIEPGQFKFRLSGEAIDVPTRSRRIEGIEIRLGYTHKGIEHLFQTTRKLNTGLELAERVAGDCSFAHGLAYCRAVETLLGTIVPPAAEAWRGIFLELERIANHIGDCATMVQDLGMDLRAADLSDLREWAVRLCHWLSGHRLLRGVNRPGGLKLPLEPEFLREQEYIETLVSQIATAFEVRANEIASMASFRERLQWTAILTQEQALRLGATGLVARASGLRRDWRLQHPQGIYSDPELRKVVAKAAPPELKQFPPDRVMPAEWEGQPEAWAGDALARFLARVREVQNSSEIIRHILKNATLTGTLLTDPDYKMGARAYEFAWGYAESWRGPVVYWVMKDKADALFRVKVCDPSMLNWPALRAAIAPHTLHEPVGSAREHYYTIFDPPGRHAVTLLADFPIANASFNNSYSGNDL
jgi:Ni,Fe-hydrogenase III large subunit/Ni,Fe-hydrogenase III component G